jgi:2'-5' RNA ligase
VKQERIRLFFALWPPDGVREALWRSSAPLREACGGQPVAKRNLHLTLLFLGGVAERCLPGIEAAAADIQAPRFSLVFDGWGRFDKARVAWLGCRHPDPGAAVLAGGLAEAMADLGFPPERRPFWPHLTVLRKCRDGSPVEPVAPVTWPVEEFTLVRSLTLPSGPVYEVIARWPLVD